MSGYDFSLALMVPDALRTKGNLLACALGHDQLPGDTFSVALSADGAEPATHWGCHSRVQQSFVETLSGAEQGHLPPVDWAVFNLTPQHVQQVLAELKASEPQNTPLDFDAWAATHGLQKVVYEG